MLRELCRRTGLSLRLPPPDPPWPAARPALRVAVVFGASGAGMYDALRSATQAELAARLELLPAAGLDSEALERVDRLVVLLSCGLVADARSAEVLDAALRAFEERRPTHTQLVYDGASWRFGGEEQARGSRTQPSKTKCAHHVRVRASRGERDSRDGNPGPLLRCGRGT